MTRIAQITTFIILWLLLALAHSQLVFRALTPLTNLFSTRVEPRDYLILAGFTLLAITGKMIFLRLVLGMRFDGFIRTNLIAISFALFITFLYTWLLSLFLYLIPLTPSHFASTFALASNYFVFRLVLHSVQYFSHEGQLSKAWLITNIFCAGLIAVSFPQQIGQYANWPNSSISSLFLGILTMVELITAFSYIGFATEKPTIIKLTAL